MPNLSNQTTLLRDDLIFKAGQIAVNVGLNKSMGQLYTALYLTKRAIPLDELAKICRMSKGTASINLRRLDRWGAVRKVWSPRNRKDHYEANRDIIGFAMEHGKRLFADILEQGEKALKNAGNNISLIDSGTTEAALYRESLNELDGVIKKLKEISKNLFVIGTIFRAK